MSREVSRETPPTFQVVDPAFELWVTGPLTERPLELNGRLYTVLYHAEWEPWADQDPTKGGWRVTSIETVPAEAPDHYYSPGDLVPVYVRMVEDAGPDIKVAFEDPGRRQEFWIKRSAIARPKQAP